MTLIDNSDNTKKIEIRPNGPYIVSGEIPLVQKDSSGLGIWRAADVEKRGGYTD